MGRFSNWLDKVDNAAGSVTGTVSDAASAAANAAVSVLPNPVENVVRAAAPTTVDLVSAVARAGGSPAGALGTAVGNRIIPPIATQVLPASMPVTQNQGLGASIGNILMVPEAKALYAGAKGAGGLVADAVTAAPSYTASWFPKFAISAVQLAKHPSVGTFFAFAANAADPYLRIANVPVERQHLWQAAGAYSVATNGGKVRTEDQNLPFNFAVKWAQQHPEEWQNIVSVHDNGYDSNGDGTADYEGDEAVWEYFIGKQSNAVRVAADVVNDPWNLTLVLGGIEAVAGRASAEAFLAGSAKSGETFAKIAKAAGWSDKAISAVMDAPFYPVKKAAPYVAKLPGVDYLLRESEGGARQRVASEAESVIARTPGIVTDQAVPAWAEPIAEPGTFVVVTPEKRPGTAYVVDPSGNPIPGFSFEGDAAVADANRARDNFIDRGKERDTTPTGVNNTPVPEIMAPVPQVQAAGFTPIQLQTAAQSQAVAASFPKAVNALTAHRIEYGGEDALVFVDDEALRVAATNPKIMVGSFDGRNAVIVPVSKLEDMLGPAIDRGMPIDITPMGSAPSPTGSSVPGFTPAEFQQTATQRAEALGNGDLSVFAPRLGDRRVVTIAQDAAASNPEGARQFFDAIGLDAATGTPIIGGRTADAEARHAMLENSVLFNDRQGGLTRKVVEQKLVYADNTINTVVPSYRDAFGESPSLMPGARTGETNAATFIAMTNADDSRTAGIVGLVDLALYDAGPEGDKAARALNGMSGRQYGWLKDESPITGKPVIAQVNTLRKKMKSPDLRPQLTYTPFPEVDAALPVVPRTPTPVTDPVDRWLGEARIDEGTAAFLRSTPVGLDRPLIDTVYELERQGLSERQIREKITDRIRKDIGKNPIKETAGVAGKASKKRQTGVIGTTDKLIRFVKTETKANRQRMQYSMLNAVPGGLGDMLGNTTQMWQAGDLSGAYKLWEHVGDALRGEERVGDYFSRAHNDMLKGLDMDFVAPDSLKFGAGDTQIIDAQRLDRAGVTNRAVRGAQQFTASDRVMTMRHGIDALARDTTRETAMKQAYPETLRSFMQTAEKRGYDLSELGPGLRDAIRGRGVKGPYFSPEDVRALTGDAGLAKAWREELAGLKRTGDAEVRDRFFENAKRTNLDDALGKVMYFHFWQSRAMALQLKNMVRQPRVLGGYYRLMDGAYRQSRESNQPDWAQGMMKYYSGPGGFYGLTGAVQFLVPAAMFLDLGQMRDDQTTIQKVMSILPVNPFLNAAAAVLGKSDNIPNLLGTGRTQTLVRNVQDFMAAEGLVAGTFTEDYAQWATRATLNVLNNGAQQIPGIDDWQPYNPKEGSLDTAASVIWHLAEEDFGPSDGWTGEQYAEVNTDIASLETGSPTPRADLAFDALVEARVLNMVPQFTVPGGSILRYGPRDEAMALNREGSEATAAGLEPTTEQQNASDQRDFATASPFARDLMTEKAKVEALGTERQKALYQGVIAIRYLDDSMQDSDYVEIAGQRFTVGQLRTLSEDQRKLVADQWVLDQGPDAADELDAFYSMRSSAKAQSTLLTTEQQYRDLIGQFPSTRAFRDWAAAEYPMYREAMESYRNYLVDTRGTSAEMMETELDQWATSPKAFVAISGKNDSRYDTAPETGGYDFGPPTVGGSSSGGGSGVVDRIKTDQAQYGRTMDDLKAQGYSDTMIQWLGQYGGNAIALPSVSPETQAYYAWRDRQATGADTSVEAYGRWIAGVAPTTQEAPVALR